MEGAELDAYLGGLGVLILCEGREVGGFGRWIGSEVQTEEKKQKRIIETTRDANSHLEHVERINLHKPRSRLRGSMCPKDHQHMYTQRKCINSKEVDWSNLVERKGALIFEDLGRAV